MKAQASDIVTFIDRVLWSKRLRPAEVSIHRVERIVCAILTLVLDAVEAACAARPELQ